LLTALVVAAFLVACGGGDSDSEAGSTPTVDETVAASGTPGTSTEATAKATTPGSTRTASPRPQATSTPAPSGQNQPPPPQADSNGDPDTPTPRPRPTNTPRPRPTNTPLEPLGITILAPREGATVGSTFAVRVDVTGIELNLGPNNQLIPGAGHWHIALDTAPPLPDQYDTTSTSFGPVGQGQHTITVLLNLNDVDLTVVAIDQVRITVR